MTVSDETVHLVPDERYLKWIRGFDVLASEGIGQEQVDMWEAAVEMFYVQTQRFAHVLSGDMKRSGRMEARKDGPLRVVGTVRYGGVNGTKGPVDYVAYEVRRGGSHDFFSRGMGVARKRMQKAVGDAAFRRLKELMN